MASIEIIIRDDEGCVLSKKHYDEERVLIQHTTTQGPTFLCEQL